MSDELNIDSKESTELFACSTERGSGLKWDSRVPDDVHFLTIDSLVGGWKVFGILNIHTARWLAKALAKMLAEIDERQGGGEAGHSERDDKSWESWNE